MNAPRLSAHVVPEPGAAYRRRRLGRTQSAVIGVLIVVLGLAGSAFVAGEWHSSLQAANERSFGATAADLGSALNAKLEADLGLTRTMRAIATMEPGRARRASCSGTRSCRVAAPRH